MGQTGRCKKGRTSAVVAGRDTGADNNMSDALYLADMLALRALNSNLNAPSQHG